MRQDSTQRSKQQCGDLVGGWSADDRGEILPHFDRYPLQSGKLQDYLVFREIVLRMRAKEHLHPGGFLELARLAFTMNATGKQRQYTLAVIESGILRGHTPDLFTERKIWSDLHGDVQSVAEQEMTTPRL
jgi:hypothetical protein